MAELNPNTREFMRANIKIFRMDYDGYEYWAGLTAEGCYEAQKNLQGWAEEEHPFSEVVQMSNKDVDTWTITFDEGEEPLLGISGKTVTFREYLNALIDLNVEFPRYIAGTES